MHSSGGDVPDNVSESHTGARPFPGPRQASRRLMYRITGHYPVVSAGRSLFRETEQQLAHGPRERWLVDGDVGPGRSDDDVAVNGDSPYRFG